MIMRVFGFALLLGGLALLGCSSASPSAQGGGGVGGVGGVGGSGGEPDRSPVVVTADWLNQSLTILDYDRLTDGESDAAAAILSTIDLSEWNPGPVEVELTPDGRTAVVSVGPAFFDGIAGGFVGSPEVSSGGTLLIVDLGSGDVDEVPTEDVPLGIAISPDGTTAYTANYGTGDSRGDSLSIIDIETRTVIDEVTVGSGPEQVALSADGSLGIINVVSAGGVRVFQTSDVAGTLTAVIPTGSDPSDVTFLEGNDYAVVANSQSFDVTLVDTSNPDEPAALGSTLVGVGIPYGVTYVPARAEVLAPTAAPSTGLPTALVTLTRDGDSLDVREPLRLSGENFPLAAAADRSGAYGFVAHIVDHELSVVELATGQVRSIQWLTQPGPSYVAVQP